MQFSYILVEFHNVIVHFLWLFHFFSIQSEKLFSKLLFPFDIFLILHIMKSGPFPRASAPLVGPARQK